MRNQQKRWKEKRKQPSKTPSFFFFLSSFFVFSTRITIYIKITRIFFLLFGALPTPSTKLKKYIIIILCKWLWVVRTKRTKERKRRKGFLEGSLLFSFHPFCWSPKIVCFKKFFSVQIWSFFVFWKFKFWHRTWVWKLRRYSTVMTGK